VKHDSRDYYHHHDLGLYVLANMERLENMTLALVFSLWTTVAIGAALWGPDWDEPDLEGNRF
jgi:hypothetical protein